MHVFLEKIVEDHSDRIAALTRDREFTYAELLQRVRELCCGLSLTTAGKGDRIVICFANVYDFILSYLAVSMAGYVPVLVTQDTPIPKLYAIINEVDARGLIGHAWMAPGLSTPPAGLEFVVFDKKVANKECPPLLCWSLDELGGLSGGFENGRTFNNGDAFSGMTLMYTSGTTGPPKGVMLSHKNLEYATGVMIEFLDLIRDDRVLVTMPFAHCAGLLHMLAHIRIGGSLVTDVPAALPGAFLKAVLEKNVTSLPAVPSLVNLFLSHYPKELSHYPAGLRYVELSSEPYDSSLALELAKALPKTAIYNTYGLTEAPRATYHHVDADKSSVLSIGVPNRDISIRIVDSRGRVCGVGESGEIFISGLNIAVGYWNRPLESGKIFTVRGVRTGDVGYRDAAGRIYLQGRSEAMEIA